MHFIDSMQSLLGQEFLIQHLQLKVLKNIKTIKTNAWAYVNEMSNVAISSLAVSFYLTIQRHTSFWFI